MGTWKKVGIVGASSKEGGAALALLDRFLAGYPHDGVIRGRLATDITLYGPQAGEAALERRRRDFGLKVASSLGEAVSGAEGVVVVPADGEGTVAAGTLTGVVEGLRSGGVCFVVGLLAGTGAEAQRISQVARRRGVRLGAAGLLSATFRLPEPGRRNTRRQEGLIVVQGEDALAKADGVLGLLPELDLALVDAHGVRRYEQDAVWRAGAQGEWSWDLLAAALSRSNNPLGDPVLDGRTQDLAGLGLVPRLAQRPRAWVTEHADGVRTAILALDGVVGDVNLATRDRAGVVHSAQLYRPPAPNVAGYHRLAGLIEGFLGGAALPWPERRSLEAAAWWEALS